MTDYVLEILDGDRAGETVELSASEPVTFGRRAGNTVVLSDEKVSGRHATLSLEEGQWVLRDLNSTNGTRIDGREITEVGLSTNDIFQLGRIHVGFKERGAPTPQIGGDLAVRQVDAARLAKTKRGGGIGLLLVVTLLLAAGGVYWFYGGGEAQVTGNQSQPSRPLVVAGNMLAEIGNMEQQEFANSDAEPWIRDASGLQFGYDTGAANTGVGCLTVLGAEAEGSARHALLRSRGKLAVSASSGLVATAHLMTAGQAQASLRLRFWSAAESGPQAVLITGSTPKVYEEYEKVTVEVGVPAGCDRVSVEVLALLPDNESEVFVDDIALVEGATKAPNFTTSVGQRVTGSGGAMAIMDAESIILAGVRPLATGVLQELDQAGQLCLSDAGGSLKITEGKGQVDVQCEGASGLRFSFEARVAAGGVLVATEGGAFQKQEEDFAVDNADQILLGYGTSRFLIDLASPGAVAGSIMGDAFVLTMSDAASLAVVYDFSAHQEKARELLSGAEVDLRAQAYAAVLDKVDAVLAKHPHDDRQYRKATAVRTQAQKTQAERLAYLEAEMENAVYFESLGGYQRIRDELKGFVEQFGEAHLLEAEKVKTMQSRVAETITRIEAVDGAAVREKLTVLARVYEKAGNKDLVTLIQGYVAKHLPAGGTEEDK